ncbi:MAG: DUF4325 domain-containing protein [Lachnospiraceae bacterium]|nr:DUF4325 domain-containing protein [Lachnospiraceae bacterium]
MSFTQERREQIKGYILEKITERQDGIAKKTADNFQISLNSVYRYFREMEKDGIIKKGEKGYRLVNRQKTILLKRSKGELLEEDSIFKEYIEEYIKGLQDNVVRIWQYSFMEMMNNAIDHSLAEDVYLIVSQNYMDTTIMIVDNGVGIFQKIKDYYQYPELEDAIQELFKGKLTTDSEHHSGEGIFFTSRILDSFAAVSDGKIFAHDKFSEKLMDIAEEDALKNLTDGRGTIIYMRLSNFSKKVLKEVFDMFSDTDGGFVKTRVPVKNIFEMDPVSRSQAKRLCQRLDKFREVELDFEGVQDIGQGFAHELFVVFQNAHKEVRLTPVNASADIEKMIHHVKG